MLDVNELVAVYGEGVTVGQVRQGGACAAHGGSM